MAKSTSVKCPIAGHMIKVYETEKDALTYIKFNAEGDGSLKAYYCTVCGGWHVSNRVPNAEEMQQVYDMIDKKHEEEAFVREQRKEQSRTQSGYIETMQNLIREMREPDAEKCEQYLLACYEKFPKLLQAGGTKRSAKHVFGLYGIDIERELLTLNEENVDFKEKIMNLADKMKKVMQGVKVVDKIDLTKVPDGTHPEKASKDDKKYMRKMHELRDEAHNIEIVIADLEKQYDEDDVVKKAQERKQKELRKLYLESRKAIRDKYADLTYSNDERQSKLSIQGIRPEKMDVVHFHVPITKSNKQEMDGVALVRDENHYYLAVDLYEQPSQEDNITTILDENSDGTFEGIWPAYTVLKKAQKFEEKYMRTLVDKYADDIEKAEELVSKAEERDEQELMVLTADISDLTTALDAYGAIDAQLHERRARLARIKEDMDALTLEYQTKAEATAPSPEPAEVASPEPTPEPSAEQTPLLDFCDDTPESDLTDYEQRYQHLAYVRGKRNLEDMSYPFIETEYKSWLRFRLMANVARLFEKVAAWKPLTYVLSDEYMEELKSRAKSAYRGMMPQDVVAEGEITNGILVFNNQGCEDTIIYEINNVAQLSIIVTYIREGKLMFYESYSEQQVIGRPRIDNYMCDSMRDSGTDINRMFAFVRNLVVSFLAMERDMERTMKNMIADGKGTEEVREIKPEVSLRTDLNEDVIIRDSNWYSSISIDHLIPVQGYVSHRWCGKGKEKYLKQVWVRPHSRNGYHREAGVTKANSNSQLDTTWE